MHISKVELENIKSHVNSTYHFSRGTTAITGENGAGKTTIIEAIAWTLFDLLDYKKEDFARRGATKGVAKVTFESGLDEREYVVHRDTATGYYVDDPALKMRIANKREEVTRFLWQHLGLEPGTDLRSLFKEAVGVPQGTLTAIFLATPGDRKVTFDRLLKVEEYRQAAEKLRETTRFIDNSIFAVRENIARAEGELERSESAEREHAEIAAQAETLASDLESLSANLAEKHRRIAALDEAEKKVGELTATLDRLKADRSKAEFIFQQRETELRQANRAADTIKLVKAESDRHVEILGRLKELERERNERDKLRVRLAEVEAAIVNVRADQKYVQEAFENALTAHREIESLKPKVKDQESLENEVESFRDQLAHAKAIKNQIKSLDERLERLRESYKQSQAQLKDFESKAAFVDKLPDLEKRDTELVFQIASLRASLERDQKFQAEIKNGLCPILSQKCLNLKEGETLEGFVTSQFSELKVQIDVLEKEKTQVGADLRLAREAERTVASLETLKTRVRELSDEGTQLKGEREALQKQLEGASEIEKQLSAVETKLKDLDNPKARISFYENEAAREADLRRDITKIEKNLERLESDRRLLVEQLELYKDLDEIWVQLTETRDATAESHRTFLTNEALANSVAARENALESSRKELAALGENLDEVEKEVAAATKDYDREHHLSEKALLLEAEKRYAEMRATFEAVKKREEQLAGELKRFAELRASLQTGFKEKERLERTAEVATFIRDTLKEAAPRVARNYVYHVSIEANQMFREITGRAEQTLEWAEDYGIMLEEDGYKRPFMSLSGGEQMAAALSVRLAILKQLSDIRIAFFDEPTTNMDVTRRENLAMQLSQIKNFDQLFVISHDDTFHEYMDNEVRVGD